MVPGHGQVTKTTMTDIRKKKRSLDFVIKLGENTVGTTLMMPDLGQVAMTAMVEVKRNCFFFAVLSTNSKFEKAEK